MMIFTILFCHVLLLGIALSSPVENKVTEKKPILEVTTHVPLKVNAAKNLNAEQVQSVNNAETEKSATKKRNVPEVLTDKNEYFDDDFYEGRATDDYDSNQVLKAYLDSSRIGNSLLNSGRYKVNDYRFYDEDTRRKRTAAFDDILSKTDNYREPEIRLSPEDLMVLAAYRQQNRVYNNLPYGRWNDINNAIDLPDAEVETDEVYDRPENFFDRYYDQRYQNWANLPRSNKFLRQRRSYPTYPKLRVPVYKRSIL